ncbi:MAG: hypothetical protein P9L94_18485 [Candidatus Hinthialibacter antarcticus]|nr:hypothetical protein [Candidatus Hinthialibacter antarcticus]
MFRKVVTVSVFALCLAAIPTASFSQDVQLPLTWNGSGDTTFIAEYGTNSIDFDINIKVAEDGTVTGGTSTDEGDAKIKHLFYGEKKEHQIPGLKSQKIILVLLLNEYSSDSALVVLNGTILSDRFFFGDISFAQYEQGGSIAKALQVNDKIATEIYEDYLSSELKSALKQCLPFGTFKAEGKLE